MLKMKYLQNKIAESRLALPLTAITVIALWLLTGLRGPLQWEPLAFILTGTYLMVELNNRNALMRTYSRMVSCSFLVFDLAVFSLFSNYHVGLVQISAILTYLLLFHAYQDKEAHDKIFYAFCILGVASIFEVKVLWLVPVLWILLATCLMAMSLRNFLASVFGLLTPYWLVIGYNTYEGHITILTHFEGLTTFGPIADFSTLPLWMLVTLGLLLLLTIIGTIHFLHYSYNDKIRTRMLFEIFITMSFLSLAFIVLQPTYSNVLIPLLIVNMSPLVGHVITFTHTRFTNIAFAVLSLVTLGVLLMNLLWQP